MKREELLAWGNCCLWIFNNAGLASWPSYGLKDGEQRRSNWGGGSKRELSEGSSRTDDRRGGGKRRRKIFRAQQWGTGAYDSKWLEKQLLLPDI